MAALAHSSKTLFVFTLLNPGENMLRAWLHTLGVCLPARPSYRDSYRQCVGLAAGKDRTLRACSCPAFDSLSLSEDELASEEDSESYDWEGEPLEKRELWSQLLPSLVCR